jgi:signal transduction histidine kinase
MMTRARIKAKRRVRRSVTSRSLALFLVIGAFALMAPILAVLEYRWAMTVSEASRERIQEDLQDTLNGVRIDLKSELRNLGAGLQPLDSIESSVGLNRYAQQLEAWRRNSAHPDLVANVYIYNLGQPSGELQWDQTSKRFESTIYPGRFRSLTEYLRARSQGKIGPSERRTPPAIWVFAGLGPVVVQPLFDSPPARPESYLLVELRPDVLQGTLFPELLSRHIGQKRKGEYRLGVLSARHPGTLIYRSSPGLSPGSFQSYDGKLILLGPGSRTSLAPQASDLENSQRRSSAAASFSEGPDSWEMIAKDWRGSLVSQAEIIRLRYLGINLGVLLALALAMATIIVYAFRAQNLLRLQMEFVASVSHDLRTPLSVIGSAADNLAEGVVRSDPSVREYGSLIRSECRRLAGMVEQTLRFAAGKADYRTRNIQFFRVADVIEDTLREAAAIIDASGFDIDKKIDPDLPMLRADARALSECLLNFISNALKYGGDRQWLGIRAQPVETGRGTSVQITVEDRGLGIPSDELPHIFDPFYRGRNARSAQISGTGLGLSLAQEAANSMGARITVESAPGEGSAFTIHFPAAYMNSSTIPVEALVES